VTSDLRRSIRRRLRDAGKRLTAERELLFDIISSHPHLDAAGIHKLALEVNPRIGQATVYRTLNLLAELELVDVRALGESHGHYEIRADDHAHAVCLGCGRLLEIPPPKGLREIEGLEGFDVRRTQLELIGYCEDCRRALADSNARAVQE
jgi:Fur family ferric uptake transcriptional regulator